MKTSEIAPLGVRMPPELKEHLRAAAETNRRSLNSEVVRRLEESVAAEKEKAPNA
jgi:predicted HicB family RNase H-like nuclease